MVPASRIFQAENTVSPGGISNTSVSSIEEPDTTELFHIAACFRHSFCRARLSNFSQRIEESSNRMPSSSVYSRDAWLDDHSNTQRLDDYPEAHAFDIERTLHRHSFQRMQTNEPEYIPRGPRHYASTEPINALPTLPTSKQPSKEPIVYIVGWKLVLLLVGYVLGSHHIKCLGRKRITRHHDQGVARHLPPKS